MELGPLGVRASKRLLKELLLEEKSEDSVNRVALQAGGNPFLLEELARAVAQGRGAELPETVLATAQARLETLSPSLRRVLRAAAVLGDALSEDGLSALLVDLNKEERQARLAELVHEDILEPDASMPGNYRFRQVVIREASYASLTAADKKLAHALAAKWLTSRGGADPLALAIHFERAGKPTEACVPLVAAAEQSVEGQDFDGALERLARAEACGASGEILGELLLTRAEVQRWRGDFVAERDSAKRATSLLPEGTVSWIAAKVHEQLAAGQLGDTGPAESLATLLCILLEGGDVSGPVVSAAARTCTTLGQLRASPLLTRLVSALSIAMQTCKDDRAVGAVFSALAASAENRNELEDAVELGEASITSFTRAGDVRNACNTRMNTAYRLLLLGQYKRAEAALREGLATAERAGVLTIAALVRHNLGPVLLHNGDAKGAEEVEREAVRAYEAQGNKRLVGGSRYYLGRILIALGRLDEAEAEMRRACADVETIPAVLPLARAGLAFALLARGKLPEALVCAREAMAKFAERDGAVEEPRTVKLALVEALIASGEAAEGQKLLAELSVELLEQASRLRNPELRRTFLHEVSDHARIFELQAGLAGTE